MDLDAWINEPPAESESDSDDPETNEHLFVDSDKTERSRQQPEPTEEEITKSREARKYEQMNNPHYLKGVELGTDKGGDMELVPPITEIDLSVPLKIVGQKRSDKYLTNDRKSKAKKNKKKKKKKTDSSSDDENVEAVSAIEVKRDLELPEGATLSDSDSSHGHLDDPHRALNIDLEL